MHSCTQPFNHSHTFFGFSKRLREKLIALVVPFCSRGFFSNAKCAILNMIFLLVLVASFVSYHHLSGMDPYLRLTNDYPRLMERDMK